MTKKKKIESDGARRGNDRPLQVEGGGGSAYKRKLGAKKAPFALRKQGRWVGRKERQGVTNLRGGKRAVGVVFRKKHNRLKKGGKEKKKEGQRRLTAQKGGGGS